MQDCKKLILYSFFSFPICFYVKQIHKNLIVNNKIKKCQSLILVVLNKPPDITDINIIKLFIYNLLLIDLDNFLFFILFKIFLTKYFLAIEVIGFIQFKSL